MHYQHVQLTLEFVFAPTPFNSRPPRQRQLFEALLQGETLADMAQAMSVSELTVEHIAAELRQLWRERRVGDAVR